MPEALKIFWAVKLRNPQPLGYTSLMGKFLVLLVALIVSCQPKNKSVENQTPNNASPKATEQKSMATLAQTQGVVKIKSLQGSWSQAKGGSALHLGEQIIVKLDSLAQINLQVGGRLALQRNSDLKFLSKDPGIELGLRDGVLKVDWAQKSREGPQLLIKTPLGWISPINEPGVYSFEIALLEKYFAVTTLKGDLQLQWQGKQKTLRSGQKLKKRIIRKGPLVANFDQMPKPLPYIKEIKKFAVVSPRPKSKVKKDRIRIVAEVVDDQAVYFEGEKLIAKHNRVQVDVDVSPGYNIFNFMTILDGVTSTYRYEVERIQ